MNRLRGTNLSKAVAVLMTAMTALAAVTASVSSAAQDNAKTAWDFFLAHGFTERQAAGIIGNLEVESGLNPRISQTGGGPGRGIAQWSAGDRWDSSPVNLVDYAHSKGWSEWTLTAQLNFIVHELNSNAAWGLAELKASTSIAQATTVFAEKYERCRGCAGGQGVRTEQAYEAYNTFHGTGGNNAVTCVQGVRMFQLRAGGAELWYSSVSGATNDSGIEYFRWRKVYAFPDKKALSVAAQSQTKDAIYLYVTDADGGLRMMKYATKTGNIERRWLHDADASTTDSDPYALSRLTASGDHLFGVSGGKLSMIAGLDNWKEPSSHRQIKTIGYPAAFFGTGDAENELGYTDSDGALRYINISAKQAVTTKITGQGWKRSSVASPGGGMLLRFNSDGTLWRQYIDDPAKAGAAKISSHKTLATGTTTPDAPITTVPSNCSRG